MIPLLIAVGVIYALGSIFALVHDWVEYEDYRDQESARQLLRFWDWPARVVRKVLDIAVEAKGGER